MTFIQAIHCRSLVPCQDTPSNKVTYGAKVAFLKKKSLTIDMETVPFIYIYINTIWWQITAPHDLTVLMSAIRQGEPVAIGDKKTHCFNQPVPIPSYLCVWTSTPTPLTIILSYCVYLHKKKFYITSYHVFCQKLISAKTARFISAFFLPFYNQKCSMSSDIMYAPLQCDFNFCDKHLLTSINNSLLFIMNAIIWVLWFLPTIPLIGGGMPPMLWQWQTTVKFKE